MPSPLVCYVPGCKYLATERCGDCMKPICDSHAWGSQLAQPYPGDFEWRCPECYSAFMSRRFREAMEELQGTRADLARANLEVATWLNWLSHASR